MTDSEKLRKVASWFDIYLANTNQKEKDDVPVFLRDLADRLEKLKEVHEEHTLWIQSLIKDER